MKPATRLALLLSLVLGIVLGIPALALADHELGHDHPFCAQGGELVTGGAGGVDVDDILAAREARQHFEPAGAAAAERPILVPQGLADRFTNQRVEDPDGDGFVQVAQPAAETAIGTNATQFHGGHGGGPGGGQGGATLLNAAGDGGCAEGLRFPSPSRRVTPPTHFVPGRRLPITGPSTQFLLMGGAFVALGASFVFGPQLFSWAHRWRHGAAVATAGAGAIVDGPALVVRSGEVVPRLRDAVGVAWRS